VQTIEALRIAEKTLEGQAGHIFDVFTLARPKTTEEAVNYLKIISKLSPLVGNLIELNVVTLLNGVKEFAQFGKWKRQDPDFPDALFEGKISPAPGLEIKAWFPLATEITARFKDSQNHFLDDRTYVALLAWLPESLIYGRPKLIEACVVSGMSVAKARDDHYHNPPDYLVLEPEDTKSRTRNLQQTNTNGYKFQGTLAQRDEATKIVESWGKDGAAYKPNREYQDLLRQLIGRFPYRLDTNFAKMDRIGHPELEKFKDRVIESNWHGQSIYAWAQALFSENENLAEAAVKKLLEQSVDG
jgi:hypothetical protein